MLRKEQQSSPKKGESGRNQQLSPTKKSMSKSRLSSANMKSVHSPFTNSMISPSHDKAEIGGIKLYSIKEFGAKFVIASAKDQASKLVKNPSLHTIEEIFKVYCEELSIPPVNFLVYYKEGILELRNYNIQPNLCIAIACVIPFLSNLECIRLKNNDINDEGSSLLLTACCLNSKFRQFHLEKNMINHIFVNQLREVMSNTSLFHGRIQELNLSSSKNASKVISQICEVIKDNLYLVLLNLSNINLDTVSCKYISILCKSSVNLQILDLSYCGIRGHSARMLLNSILLNTSLKYLNLCWNSFASLDYEFGSKLARIIQVHPSLMHLDLTCTQLKREETMYMAQCLKDSQQILSCHLTGNHVDYYSRIFLRAHLNAIVQFPFKNSVQIASTIMSHDRIQVLFLNQIIQSNLPAATKQKAITTALLNDQNYKAKIEKKKNEQMMQQLKKDIEITKLDMDAGAATSPNNSKQKGASNHIQTLLTSVNHEDQIQYKSKLDQYLQDVKSRIYELIQNCDIYGRESNLQKLRMNQEEMDEQNNKDQLNLTQNEQEEKKSKRKSSSMENDFQKAFNLIFQAYDDKQLANPMQGFLKDLIFTRYLGHPEIQECESWRDCNQCWVCEKWEKVKITFQITDGIQDKEFQELMDFTSILREENDNKRELNPIWEEQYDSLDEEGQIISGQEEQSLRSQKQRKQSLNSQLTQSRVIIRVQDNPIYREPFTPLQKHSTQMVNENGEQLLAQKMPTQNNIKTNENSPEKGMNISQNNAAGNTALGFQREMYDMSIIKVTSKPQDIVLDQIKQKTLYNTHISCVKMDANMIRNQVIPTMNYIQNNNNNNSKQSQKLIINNGFVPYKPFKREGAQTANSSPSQLRVDTKLLGEKGAGKKKEIIKLPSITNYKSQPSSPKKFQNNNNSNNNSNLLQAASTAINSKKVSENNGGGDGTQPNSPTQRMTKKQKEIQDIKAKYQQRASSSFKVNIDSEEDLVQLRNMNQLKRRNNQSFRISKEDLKEKNFERLVDMPYNRVKKKNEIVEIRHDILQEWKSIPETEDVYLVASFNYWYPIKMEKQAKKKILVKDELTKKQLQQKQDQRLLQMQKELSKEIFAKIERKYKQKQLDLNIYKTLNKEEEKKYEKGKIKVEPYFSYVNFLPSGKHYFYYIKNSKFYCLSDKYGITKFKKTNLYMNYIEIQQREWKITEVKNVVNLNEDEKHKFDKTKSIFKNFKEDNEDILRKMFELDFSYSKINRVIRNESELELTKECLWQNYVKIRGIYLNCIVNSEYPVMSWNDFTSLCNRCKIVDKVCNLATIDRIYIATNVSFNNNSNADRDLNRFEFLEILVRIANSKFKESGICTNNADALTKLLEDHIYPNMNGLSPNPFRTLKIYTNKVNELLTRNEQGLKKLFGLFIHGTKRYLTSKDAIELINQKAEFKFLDKVIIKCFALSKMSTTDILKEPGGPNKMQLVEFYEFITRVAFECFKDHVEMAPEPLHLKVDALLTKLFKLVKFQKQFTYLDITKQNVINEVSVLQSSSQQQIEKLGSNNFLQENDQLLQSFHDKSPRKQESKIFS